MSMSELLNLIVTQGSTIDQYYPMSLPVCDRDHGVTRVVPAPSTQRCFTNGGPATDTHTTTNSISYLDLSAPQY